MKKYGLLLMVIALAMSIGFSSAFAKESKIVQKQELAKAVKVNMADALSTAMNKVSGTVLNAEVEKENGKIIYSFEILPTPDSKEIKEINVDAETGAIIKEETENDQSEGKEANEEMKESKEKGEKWAKGEKEEKDEEGEGNEKEEKGENHEKGKWDSLKIKVSASKLPAAVKSAIKKEMADANIESASTMPKIYVVEVKSGEETHKLMVTSTGKVIEKEKAGKEENEQGEKDEKDEKNEQGEKD